jgi:hypothetical protein
VFFGHSFEVVHKQFGEALFAAFGGDGDGGDVSVPFLFGLFALDLAEDLVRGWVR